MPDFRNDLLEALLKADGNTLDIQELVVANCGDGGGMYDNESTRCRQRIVRILEELTTMGWISVAGNDYAFHLTAHQFDISQGKQDYSKNPIWVRLTTQGAIDYKKSIAPPVIPQNFNYTTHGNNSPIIGGNVTIGDNQEEGIEIAKKGFTLSKVQTIVAILGLLLLIAGWLLSYYKIWPFH